MGNGLISMAVKFSHEFDIFSFSLNSLLFVSALASVPYIPCQELQAAELRPFVSFFFPGCIINENPVMITCEIKW